MTSIFSGQLYNNFLTDSNQYRLETYDVKRFQRTIEQQADQGQREKELREGLEYHQAKMADLQTKLNELTEKLNTLYRRFIDNKSAFRKVSQEPEYFGTSSALNGLPNINSAPDTGGYPTGAAGITPDNDYDKIRNYSWNPFFGSKAIDESDKTVNRTFWQQPNEILEKSYTENGAFWSTVSYLWGWDVDRINATYATTDNNNNLQVNVTALQPNKPQYPPMKVGDRFPIFTGNPTNYPGYPAVNISGLRPGGVDYSHASDTINTGGDSNAIEGTTSLANFNVVGQDTVNFGWEFDDLPMALEVVSVDTRPDGTTVPTAYKMVYDIPPTHPQYASLKVLNGTEPQILDAPTALKKTRIRNDGFDYLGKLHFPGTQSTSFSYTSPNFHASGGGEGIGHNPGELEMPPPRLFGAAPPPSPTYTVTSGVSGGTSANPVQLTPATNNTYNDFSVGETVTTNGVPASAQVIAIQLNKILASGTGDGTLSNPLVVDDPTSIFSDPPYAFPTTPTDGGRGGDNDVYITFSGDSTHSVYRVTKVDIGSILYTNSGNGPTNYAPGAGETVSIWSNNLASLPRWPREGLVLDSDINATKIYKQAVASSADPIGTITLTSCTPLPTGFDFSTARLSMQYRFSVHQNYKKFRSAWDDGLTIGVDLPAQNHTNHDWTSDGREYTGSGLVHNQYAYPINTVQFSYLSDASAGGVITLGESHSNATLENDGWYFGDKERVWTELRQVNGTTLALDIFFQGDLNNFQMEVQDVELVAYSGANNGVGNWVKGKDAPGNVAINANNTTNNVWVGDPTVTAIDDPDDVINKYIPGVYQYIKFNDQYNIQHSTADRNDILRSPWEFAMLNIGDNSQLSGEMWLDLNGRRLNFDHDRLEATTTAWNGTSTVAIQNPGGDFVLSAAVQNSTDFLNIATTDPNFNPGDDCHLNRSYQFSDDDPLTNGVRTDTLMDEVMPGELHAQSTLTDVNPIRTANPALAPTAPLQPDFYSLASVSPGSGYASNTVPVTFTPHSFIYGADTDNGTIDRIGASDNDFQYTMTIPTNDVNVLRNENNLAVNFGSMDETDWTLDLKQLNMDIRVATGYTTVPRYRVDAGGNIYDAFGKGYYDLGNANDALSKDRVYTVSDVGMSNDQISNYDSRLAGADRYGTYDTTYAAAGSFEAYVRNHDRLSMGVGAGANGNDDYNLFDYVPDLNLVPNDAEGRRFGETYVGSLPSNFYYYREDLDNSVDAAGGANSPTGNFTLFGGPRNFNNDGMAALNFDGRKSNMAGTYTGEHTYVSNANMPSFANVTLGYVEQNAKMYNTERTTTQAVWLGFPGLGGETKYAENVVSSTNVGIDANNNSTLEASEINAVNALGNNTAVATMNTVSQIILDMGQEVNRGGTLILNELNALGQIDPHVIPLPLLDYTAPYPDFDDPDNAADPTPTSFTFNAYGAETVTRTGSKFVSFQEILDGVDGMLDSTTNLATSMSLLNVAGGEFAVGDMAGAPNTWPSGVLLHVDDASNFDMEYPKNIVTLGTDPTEYRVVYRNTETRPQSIYLIRNDGTALGNTLPGATTVANFVHTDLQIRAKTGQYTVQVTNAAGTADPHGSHVRIDYNHLGTQKPGQLASVGISSDFDRVGRIATDDPRTTAVEPNRIAPELFDSPHGYVQPDAQVALNLVAQDAEGNPRPRRLKSVKVDVVSGEQLTPSALVQSYSTNGQGATAPTGSPGVAGYTAGTVGTFNYTDGAGHWPIALFEEDTQLNPIATTDLNYYVGLFQGITASSATAATPTVTVQDTFGLSVGQKVTINGERRSIANIAGNVVTLDSPLSVEPKIGDTVSVGNGLGTQDIQMYLNSSVAMSMGAGMKVTLEWEEYDVIGFPPRVDTANTRSVTETIGFSDTAPNTELQISNANAGTTTITLDKPITAAQAAKFTNGTQVNINGVTRKLTANAVANATTITIDQPVTTSLGLPLKSGSISQINYENFLVVGEGRSGGSKENEFTQELKRILDNPEYKEVLRMGLLKSVFISAATNDQFNDLISSKLFLNWDRIRKQVEIQQTSFMAYYKSI